MQYEINNILLDLTEIQAHLIHAINRAQLFHESIADNLSLETLETINSSIKGIKDTLRDLHPRTFGEDHLD